MGFEGYGESQVLELPTHKRNNSFSRKNKAMVDGVNLQPKALPRANQNCGSLRTFCVLLLIQICTIFFLPNIIQDMGDRSKSFRTRPKQALSAETHSSLKQEILQLEKRLQDQFEERHSLEKALGYRTCFNNDAIDDKTPKPATQLIKEIASLETEVVYLEQYLLSLYRKAFDPQIPSVSPPSSGEDNNMKSSNLHTPRGRLMKVPQPIDATIKIRDNSVAVQSGCRRALTVKEDCSFMAKDDRVFDASVQRCHSSLSQCSSAFAAAARISPPDDDFLGKAVRACQSQPLSMMEYAQNATTNIISLAEYLGTTVSDHRVPETTPNRLSEEMVKCMTVIYCKLSDPPPPLNGSSPNSSSNFSSFSPPEMWSPPGLFRSFEMRLDNPFHVDGLKEFSGPYSTSMAEIPWIHRDGKKLQDIEHLLQNYRSLICRLEEVDPRALSHEERLVFWINIHNALIMHAFLAYGIPQNSVKRVILLLKAAYNIGGHTISADTIQTTILGVRMSRPGQWLRVLFSPRKKFKAGDSRQGYAIDHPEPLLHFALCLGSHSDPAVRMYTPKRSSQELESAKEEYIRATFGMRKDKKISLPKIVDTYAKDLGLCHSALMEMIQQLLPDSLEKTLNMCQLGKSQKNIVWVPHNFRFRYLISKDLVK